MAKVESVTKFAFVADGKRYRFDDVKVDRASIVIGADIALSPKGTESEASKPSELPTKEVDSERAKKFTPKFFKKSAPDNSMSKEEWAAKDQRISRQGAIQAAVQALGHIVGPETLFSEAEKLANQMLDFVNKR